MSSGATQPIPLPRLRACAPDWRTVLSGVLIVISFPEWNLWPLIFVALVPWFWALSRTGTRGQAFVQGVWLSVIMSIGGFFWVASVLAEFGGLPWVVAITGLALYSLGGQPQFLLFAPFYRAMETRREGRSHGVPFTLLYFFALALAYTGIDWILPKLFADTLGHSFYLARNLRQAADLGGPTLLTFLVFFVNHAIWRGLQAWRASSSAGALRRPAAIALGLLAAGLIAATWAYGVARNRQVATWLEHPEYEAQGAAIQGNIGDFDKLAAERGLRGAADRVLITYFGLSDRALEMKPRPDFLVWPETTYPSTFRTPSNGDEMFRDRRVESYVRDRGLPLVFGGYDRNYLRDYNALFLLSPAPNLVPRPADSAGRDGEPPVWGPEGDLQIYRKNVLLLFGEYLPLADRIAALRNAFPQVGNFGRGHGPDVLTVPIPNRPQGGLRVGPVICYEILFPDYVIAAARKGSQLILNVTNDSWFGPRGEPYLHLALSTFRSIETRLPTVRSTNTGVTAYITPEGSIAQATGVFQPEILSVRIPVLPPMWTLMKAWGDWFGYFALVLGLGGLSAWFGLTRELRDADAASDARA